jgi:hypothetical protein
MSIIDPTSRKPPAPPVPKQGPITGAPKSAPRPAGGVNGASQTPQLKRKASGPVEGGQVKIQRKEAVGQPSQPDGAVRAASSPATSRPTPAAPTTAVPYRGTAAPASSKVANPAIRKPPPPSNAAVAVAKTAVPASRPVPAAGPASAAPKKGYLAMLARAKEKDATKPLAPPIKHEPTKILSRKERLALKAEATAGPKGKKTIAALPSRPLNPKADPSKEKRRPVEVGYQGTARPAKKPVEVGYKGTARPAGAPATSSRNGTPALKAKSKPARGNFDGYAAWSDLDEEDQEDDYASDASSDMEGGIWDVEEEEQKALKFAKKEDAEALAEEMRLKNEKEARKKRLTSMNKVAAAKKKY